ncbi:hypothetical protein KP509_24G054200 [Ceratopteris richardii]|uniref:Flap endonuclease 1 n=1 Tax=Ceratopteris richardii TaxID=49495 RepID=A0A8T2RV61_CERRI|nr:hypothetical protein KP509_24G054200 [Ceratopteris richardii]
MIEGLMCAQVQLSFLENQRAGRQTPRLPPITMGIKGLTKLLTDHAPACIVERTYKSYSGCKVAIDANLSIYQFLTVVGRKGTTLLTNEAGEVTSHLQGMFLRTVKLLEAGIKPLYVFDGCPPDLKKAEINRRDFIRETAMFDLSTAIENGEIEDIEKFSKRSVKVTKKHQEDCRILLHFMGVPSFQAAGEAEAECAVLCKSGKVHAVLSDDMDSLVFGTPKLLRYNWRARARKFPILEFDLMKALQELNLSMDQFIDMCILSGCDYCDTIKGIGPQTALKLVRKHGNLEDVLENINRERYQVADCWPFQEARMLFKDPLVNVLENGWEPEWVHPDEGGLKSFLVDENSFRPDRIEMAINKINAIIRGHLKEAFT